MTFRPRTNFSVGRMRERIDIETGTDSSTDGQPNPTWAATFSNVPAQFTPTTGGETISGQMVQANISAVFTVRHQDGYKPTQRVKHGTQYYGIVYIKPVDGGRRYVQLHCKGRPVDE